jgi:hypothetical protein
MTDRMNRRDFLQESMAGAVALYTGGIFAAPRQAIISPGCVTSKVRIAKLYLGIPGALWPTPKLDLNEEVRHYEAEFERMRTTEMADVEFVGNRLITAPDQLTGIAATMDGADGVLLIHLSMGVMPIVNEIVRRGRPTMLFAAPYSGHEWTSFGALRNRPEGAVLDCVLSSDYGDLAVAIRPFRAIHHMREATIINVSTRQPEAAFLKEVRSRFGTTIRTIGLQPVIEAYKAVDAGQAEGEAERWIRDAETVVEPPRDEILRSCRLALAFENLLAQEKASVLTVDCYGSMYRQLPAFPCVGFVRLNDMGLGGICESDLRSALIHVLAQGLCGRPGFISDPTMDESKDAIILAHCLGTRKMDGPGGSSAAYRLRTIMERQEGCVPQVMMRVGQKVTQLQLAGTDRIVYFTGDIIDIPDTERGCRTKITVRIDGNSQKLWQNWAYGLHRQTVYGDITADLARYCRFAGVQLVNEA